MAQERLFSIRPSLRGFGAVLAVVCFVGMFWFPYYVPVQPSISQSYAVGFNNRAALLLFYAACGALCLAVGGLRRLPQKADRRLTVWWLIGAVVLVLGLTISWRIRHDHYLLGPEARYFLNRQFHLSSGERLYRDFEFIYGPLLLYPGVVLLRLLHLSQLHAYMAEWVVCVALGTGMLWFVVATLDLPNPRRWVVFAFLYWLTLTELPAEGLQYTAVRGCLAAFAAALVAAVWRRTRRDALTAGLMCAAIALGFLVSPEQGFGLGLGLPAYALLLAAVSPHRFRWSAALAVVVSSGLWGAMALRLGELQTLAGMAAGGLNFPLLPSPFNVFSLAVYALGILVVYGAVRERLWDSTVLPLGLCGLPMMSSALGRCDAGHLISVVPLYVIGLSWIAGRRWIFLGWAALVCWMMSPQAEIWMRFQHLFERPGYRTSASASVRSSVNLNASPAAPPGQGIPRDLPLFAPLDVPTGRDGEVLWHASTGYYLGMQDVLLPSEAERKIRELKEGHVPYVLLLDLPDAPAVHLWSVEEHIAEVKALEGSSWGPRTRHSLPVKARMREALLAMYAPTDMREQGWRVWALRDGTAKPAKP